MPFRPPETLDAADRLLRERIGEGRGGLKIGAGAVVVNPPRRYRAPVERPRRGRVRPSTPTPVRVPR